ncbi:MAG: translation initiation factor IF-2 [Clostridia bacterium]|nr:translation initiation factor IF-2 [Clostridia bacterium]
MAVKITQIAKDMNMKPKEITDFLKSIVLDKKSGDSLDTDEWSLFLDRLTKENQIENIDDYLSGKATLRVDRPAPKKKEAVKESEAHKEEQKPEEKKEEPKAEAKAEGGAEEKKAPKTEGKQTEKQEQKVQPKPEERKPQQQPQSGKKKEKERKQRQSFKTIIPNMPISSNAPTEIVVPKNKTRVVDTRTTTVDLSRYDDRLDHIAAGKADLRGGHQKLKKQNNRPNGNAKGRDNKFSEREKMKQLEMEMARKKPLEITVPDEITVGELATRLKKTSADVIKRLIKLGMMATVNETIDYDTAYLIADEFGAKVTREVVVTIEERLFEEVEDKEEDLVERSPVVVVMGHVDHGKTSLLDAIRHTSVTKGEAGGITQHIGAYRVKARGKDMTFLDTPGHEAFTAMRARGAQATDIAILVVAADDGIMPQTVEAINHAKAAGVDIVVAINKMDKPHANPDNVMQGLTQYELVPEEWGGDVICVPVSALTGKGIDELLENVQMIAELKELRANPNRRAKGIVIEARLDRGRGPVATVLVQNGTLKAGDIVIAGTAVGHVRAMTNDRGQQIQSAGPSVPVEIIGLGEVPEVGDEFNAVEDEKMARSLAEQRRDKAKQESFNANARVNLDDLFKQISEGAKTLNIIVKADVGGSAEAVKASLLKISNEEVHVSVIHTGVGGITESDVMLASASNAIIVGFNVRPDKNALDSAERQGVDIRTYRIIYECIEEIEAAIKGMLAPEFKEVIIGHAEVRQTIHVPNVGTIAGSYVQDGKIQRNASLRVVRDGVVVFEDKISSLRRFKDDVREVASGYECGIGLERFNDLKEGDVFEAFIMEEVKK